MASRGEKMPTPAALAAQAGVPQLAASSLKAALDADWDDPAGRRWPGCWACWGRWKRSSPARWAATLLATGRQVRDQDVDLTGPAPALRRGVASDRRISVDYGQMRHGRNSRSVLSGGYKRPC